MIALRSYCFVSRGLSKEGTLGVICVWLLVFRPANKDSRDQSFIQQSAGLIIVDTFIAIVIICIEDHSTGDVSSPWWEMGGTSRGCSCVPPCSIFPPIMLRDREWRNVTSLS